MFRFNKKPIKAKGEYNMIKKENMVYQESDLFKEEFLVEARKALKLSVKKIEEGYAGDFEVKTLNDFCRNSVDVEEARSAALAILEKMKDVYATKTNNEFYSICVETLTIYPFNENNNSSNELTVLLSVMFMSLFGNENTLEVYNSSTIRFVHSEFVKRCGEQVLKPIADNDTAALLDHVCRGWVNPKEIIDVYDNLNDYLGFSINSLGIIWSYNFIESENTK